MRDEMCSQSENVYLPQVIITTNLLHSLVLYFQLLAPDIRHERNVILQCIRHIVSKSFYGIGAQRSARAASSGDQKQCESTETAEADNNNEKCSDVKCTNVIDYEAEEIWDDVKEDFS